MREDSREDVLKALIENARRQSDERRADIEQLGPVKSFGGKFIPAYAPYIGEEYFRIAKDQRIMAYAMSQNLHQRSELAERWASGDWSEGLDRQNRGYASNDSWAQMQPFDTGHIPILASMLRRLVSGRNPNDDESIYPAIAATNLSKFSFRSADGRRTCDSVESFNCCWQWFSKREVELLEPSYILCCGKEVYRTGQKGISSVAGELPTVPVVIRIAFPSLQVINSQHRKPPRGWIPSAEEIKEMVATKDRQIDVRHNRTVGTIIDRDKWYFGKMFVKMKSSLAREDGRDVRKP